MSFQVSKAGLNVYFKIPSGDRKGEQGVTISNGSDEDISLKVEPVILFFSNRGKPYNHNYV